MGKRLLTLVLDAEKLRNFQLPSKDRASVDALWMCMHLPVLCASLTEVYIFGCIIHIGVGFCVARSDGNGQCKSLQSWDG